MSFQSTLGIFDAPMAFGAYQAVVSDRPEAVRVAVWTVMAEALKTLETPAEVAGPAEVRVAAGVKPA